jgi:hypothetical protein
MGGTGNLLFRRATSRSVLGAKLHQMKAHHLADLVE